MIYWVGASHVFFAILVESKKGQLDFLVFQCLMCLIWDSMCDAGGAVVLRVGGCALGWSNPDLIVTKS